MSVLEKVGLIAGRGKLPLLFSRCAKAAGVKLLSVVAMYDETSSEIEDLADHVDWVYVGQIKKTIQAFQRQGITKVVMAGQIKPSKLFKGIRPDLLAVKALWSLRNKPRNADSIFGTACDILSEGKIEIIDSTTFLEEYLAKEGVMGKIKPTNQQQRDIDYGLSIAKEVSRLDIGQTVVVKKGSVLAVEGWEGTDKAIIRGGALGHGGAVVVKVAKPNHDMRFDVPCIGMRTVESLVKGKIKTLAVQVGKTIFVEKDETIKALNKAKISIVGVNCDW